MILVDDQWGTSWQSLFRRYHPISTFSVAHSFQENFSLIIFVIILASEISRPSSTRCTLDLNHQGGWLSSGTGGEKLRNWGPDRKRIRNGIGRSARCSRLHLWLRIYTVRFQSLDAFRTLPMNTDLKSLHHISLDNVFLFPRISEVHISFSLCRGCCFGFFFGGGTQAWGPRFVERGHMDQLCWSGSDQDPEIAIYSHVYL
jgi:hypothetical protein